MRIRIRDTAATAVLSELGVTYPSLAFLCHVCIFRSMFSLGAYSFVFLLLLALLVSLLLMQCFVH